MSFHLLPTLSKSSITIASEILSSIRISEVSEIRRWSRRKVSSIERRNFFSSSTNRKERESNPQSEGVKKYDLLFCGTDNFALPVLKRLFEEKDLFHSIQVLTPPDNVQKWGAKRMRISPVKQLAESLGLFVHTVPISGLDSLKLPPPFSSSSKNTETPTDQGRTKTETIKPLLITASFGHYLSNSFLENNNFSPFNALNLHPSLLPELRGAAPIQWSISRNLKETGVSVQRIQGEGWDVGDILGLEHFTLPENATYLTMEPILAKLGAELLVDVIRNLDQRSLEAKPQDHSKATKAPKLKRSHTEVKWKEWDSGKIEARFRGMSYMFPLSTTLIPSKIGKGIPTNPLRVLLTKVSIQNQNQIQNHTSDKSESESNSNPKTSKSLMELSDKEIPFGTSIFSEELNCLIVKCAPSSSSSENCSFLLVHDLKTEGKSERKAIDWFIGYKDRTDENGRLKFEFQK